MDMGNADDADALGSKTSRLVEMGFDKEAALRALKESGGDEAAAINALVANAAADPGGGATSYPIADGGAAIPVARAVMVKPPEQQNAMVAQAPRQHQVPRQPGQNSRGTNVMFNTIAPASPAGRAARAGAAPAQQNVMTTSSLATGGPAANGPVIQQMAVGRISLGHTLGGQMASGMQEVLYEGQEVLQATCCLEPTRPPTKYKVDWSRLTITDSVYNFGECKILGASCNGHCGCCGYTASTNHYDIAQLASVQGKSEVECVCCVHCRQIHYVQVIPYMHPALAISMNSCMPIGPSGMKPIKMLVPEGDSEEVIRIMHLAMDRTRGRY